jgi:hypothetical protein
MSDNVLKPDIGDSADYMTYMNDMASYNRLAHGHEPYDGQLDKFGDIRLRLAFIDHPENNRDPFDEYDPTDVSDVVNMNTGKVVLKWADTPGGVIRPKENSGQCLYDKKNDNYDSDLRTGDEYVCESRREMVDLGHSFIWNDGVGNWCGMNYIPPVGSKVVVGFRKQGMPLILGYTNTSFNACKPALMPGEVCTKGYGNNYIHHRWSDKLDIKAWTGKGEGDKDDVEGAKTNDTSCTLWIRLDANNRFIKLSATDADPAVGTTIFLMPDSLRLVTSDVSGGSGAGTTSYFQDSKHVTITTETMQINAKLLDINAEKITQN